MGKELGGECAATAAAARGWRWRGGRPERLAGDLGHGNAPQRRDGRRGRRMGSRGIASVLLRLLTVTVHRVEALKAARRAQQEIRA